MLFFSTRFLKLQFHRIENCEFLQCEELHSLMGQLGSEKFVERDDTEQRLTLMGASARAFLIDSSPTQPEARKRTRRILELIAPLEKTIERHELSRSVLFLARHAKRFPNIKLQLKTILPDVEPDSAAAWWQKNSEKLEWDPNTGRYLAAKPAPTPSK